MLYRKEVLCVNNKIKEVRRQKRMTQSQLAEKANVCRPYLSAIERGRQQVISNIVMEKISIALDTPVSEIFFTR